MAFRWTAGTKCPVKCVCAGDLFVPRLQRSSGTSAPVDGRGVHLVYKPEAQDQTDRPAIYGGDLDQTVEPVAFELDLTPVLCPWNGTMELAGGSAAVFEVRYEVVKEAARTLRKDKYSMTLRDLTAGSAVRVPRGAYEVMSGVAVAPTFVFGSETRAFPLPAGLPIRLGEPLNIIGATVDVTAAALTFFLRF